MSLVVPSEALIAKINITIPTTKNITDRINSFIP